MDNHIHINKNKFIHKFISKLENIINLTDDKIFAKGSDRLKKFQNTEININFLRKMGDYINNFVD